MLRTIEDILGIEPLSLNDAYQRPMRRDLGDSANTTGASPQRPSASLFAQYPASVLRRCSLPWPETQLTQHRGRSRCTTLRGEPIKTKGFDFTDADRNDDDLSNRVLWEETMPGKPYPTARSDLKLLG